MYKYKAKCLSVYDADTCTLLIDVGFNIHIKEKVRLLGIDTPEIRTKNKQEKQLAYESRDYLRLILLNKTVKIETTKKGKYGRYLVTIYLEDLNINKHLIDRGYAHEYYGKKKIPWVFDK